MFVRYMILIPCLSIKLSNPAIRAEGNKGQLEANKCGTCNHYSKLDPYIPKTGISYSENIEPSSWLYIKRLHCCSYFKEEINIICNRNFI